MAKIPLGIPHVCGSVVKNPVGILQVCAIAVKIPVGIPQVGGFALRIPVGIHHVLWLRDQEPGRDTSSFVASQSRSWLGYLKFVSSWSRSRLAYLKFCVVVVRIPAGIRQLCGQDSGESGIPPVLWLCDQDPGWDSSSLRVRGEDPGWDTSSFVASRSRSRLRYLNFCGFVLKILVGMPPVCGFVVRNPVGIPSNLWLRGHDPGRDTSSFVVSCRKFVALQSRSRFGQDPGLDTSSLWVRGQDPGRSRSRLGCIKFVGSW